jgi:glutamine phosphoribosylpyrophosphate amidotransferase
VRHQLEGKRVILVDDSIVRGTTSRKIVRMVRNAGAREVHLCISCPPTISPCFYGVDTPCESELIAANNRSKKYASTSKPIRWLSFRWILCGKLFPTRKTNTATPATPAITPLSWCRWKN